MSIKLKVRYNSELDEWSVRYYEDDVYSEAKTYYALDREDAVGTARLMADEAYRQGHKDVEVFV